MDRRRFCLAVGAAAVATKAGWPAPMVNVAEVDRARVLKAANAYLGEKPMTVTASRAERSAGGVHDFYSDSDYWWPDPKNPNGPYVRRDGETNPENFVAHRDAMRRLSIQVAALAAAWKVSRDGALRKKYAAKVDEHLRAWFVDAATRMTPNLQYAQAVHGVSTGRGTGIIDTIHLVDVAKAAEVLGKAGALSSETAAGTKAWFTQYIEWMTTSKNGKEERDAKNNHGSCWVMQVAAFAHYTGDEEQLRWCRERFRTRLVPEQIAPDGSLPLELARTKPYSYSLFDMDILATVCQILSKPGDDLWNFTTADGRTMKKVIAYMEPYIADKKKWPKPPDVQHFDEFPNRQPALLFGGLAYGKPEWVALWKRLPEPTSEEAIRNFPIRQPVLWVSGSKS